MLFDPKWEVEIKADPLTLESLIAWLEKKPAAGTYNYEDCRGACLYGQYMASHGISWAESFEGPCGPFCAKVYREVAHQYPWTFGGALERARKAVT